MVIDKYTEIANESIRRMMDECIECMGATDELDLIKIDPIRSLVDPELMKRLAAMNKVMTRIIRSAEWN